MTETPTTDALRAALTDDVLRQVGEILAFADGDRNDYGRCTCNGCNRHRNEARDVLVAALSREAPTPEPLDRAALIAAVERLPYIHPYQFGAAYIHRVNVLRLLTGGTK